MQPGFTGNPPSSDSPPRVPGTARAIRIFGVPIRFHFTFLILLAFIMAAGLGGDKSTLASAEYLVALFASVLLHELGHALVSRQYGINIREIVMYPIGGVSRLERDAKPEEELWISLAGPTVNLLIAAGILGALFFSGKIGSPESLQKAMDSNVLARIGVGNLILGLFNLIPAFPMDGGRILRAILARTRSPERATAIASSAGRMLAIFFVLFGVLNGYYMLIFIAIFVYLGAEQENAAVQGRALTHGIPVRAAMITDYRTLSHGETVRDAANLLLSTSQQDFPVVTGGQVIGLLGRNDLLRGMAAEGQDAYVAGIMNRDFVRVSPDMDLAEAMQLLAEAGSCALVMEGDRLVGLLTRENLAEFLVLRKFGMQPASLRA
jgi:Zn-dependent protease/CBS domain-containing protein